MKTIARLLIILLAGLVVSAALWAFANSDFGSRLIPGLGNEGPRGHGEWGGGGRGFRGGRLEGGAELWPGDVAPGQEVPAERFPQGRQGGLGEHRGERSSGIGLTTLATWGRNLLIITALVLVVVLLERLVSSRRRRPQPPAAS